MMESLRRAPLPSLRPSLNNDFKLNVNGRTKNQQIRYKHDQASVASLELVWVDDPIPVLIAVGADLVSGHEAAAVSVERDETGVDLREVLLRHSFLLNDGRGARDDGTQKTTTTSIIVGGLIVHTIHERRGQLAAGRLNERQEEVNKVRDGDGLRHTSKGGEGGSVGLRQPPPASFSTGH